MEQNELMHYGVIGMKWGVRHNPKRHIPNRHQNCIN